MCRWLERHEKVLWFATHLAWHEGTILDGRLRKPRRQTHSEPDRPSTAVYLAKTPQHLRVALDDLPEDYGISNFRDTMQSFLRTWHRESWRGYQSLLPPAVESAILLQFP